MSAREVIVHVWITMGRNACMLFYSPLCALWMDSGWWDDWLCWRNVGSMKDLELRIYVVCQLYLYSVIKRNPVQRQLLLVCGNAYLQGGLWPLNDHNLLMTINPERKNSASLGFELGSFCTGTQLKHAVLTWVIPAGWTTLGQEMQLFCILFRSMLKSTMLC